MHSQTAERAKELLGILEPPPQFGVEPGTVSGGVPPETPAYPANDAPGTTDVPRTPLRDTPRDVERGTVSDTPIVPPGEDVPSYVTSPSSEEPPLREEPPPGEQRPERRGAAPTSPPTPREEPPAGEERPGRRTPP